MPGYGNYSVNVGWDYYYIYLLLVVIEISLYHNKYFSYQIFVD